MTKPETKGRPRHRRWPPQAQTDKVVGFDHVIKRNDTDEAASTGLDIAASAAFCAASRASGPESRGKTMSTCRTRSAKKRGTSSMPSTQADLLAKKLRRRSGFEA